MGYWEEGGDDKSYDDACTAMVNLVKAKVSRSFQDFVVRAERGGGGADRSLCFSCGLGSCRSRGPGG